MLYHWSYLGILYGQYGRPRTGIFLFPKQVDVHLSPHTVKLAPLARIWTRNLLLTGELHCRCAIRAKTFGGRRRSRTPSHFWEPGFQGQSQDHPRCINVHNSFGAQGEIRTLRIIDFESTDSTNLSTWALAGEVRFELTMTISKTVALGRTRRFPNKSYSRTHS